MSVSKSSSLNRLRAFRGPLLFTLTLLAVEFLDELIYGVQAAALPLIRDDLALTYFQVGLLLTAPALVGNLLDPVIGVLGDVWKRKALMVGGAVVTALAMSLVAAGRDFPLLLIAFCLSYPASTAYVSLSQATLMDLNPGRHDQMMARWTVFGAAGQFAGPALVASALTLGFGWRGLYLGLAILAGAVALGFWRQAFNGGRTVRATPGTAGHGGGRGAAPGGEAETDGSPGVFRWRELPRVIRASGLVRWIVLLQLADLLLDVFYSFCALYFTDVVGVSPALAGAAVAVLTLGGLLGDVLVIPALERVDGLRLVRFTALLALGLYAAFLLAPGVWPKFALLALLGPLRSGWYQVLQGRAYSALPGRSGTVIAVGSLVGMFGASLPVLLGAVAERAGLEAAMALLMAAPIALLVGLPRTSHQGI